jgi:hypothetical protein
MDQMPDAIVRSECRDLQPNDVERVRAFMAAVVQAFEAADAGALEALRHAGGDPLGRKNSFEFNQSLMKGGDKVRSWSAKPYSEPKWEIMRSLRHHPSPTVWIDVTLHDGRRDYAYCFACSPNYEGALRSCYYVDR